MLVSIINLLLTSGFLQVLGVWARRSKDSLVVFVRDSRLRDSLLSHCWVIPRLWLMDAWVHLGDLNNSLLTGVIDTASARALDMRLRNTVDVIADLFIPILLDPSLSRDYCFTKVISLNPCDWSVWSKAWATVIELRVLLNDFISGLLLEGPCTLDLGLMVIYILFSLYPGHADIGAHATLAWLQWVTWEASWRLSHFKLLDGFYNTQTIALLGHVVLGHRKNRVLVEIIVLRMRVQIKGWDDIVPSFGLCGRFRNLGVFIVFRLFEDWALKTEAVLWLVVRDWHLLGLESWLVYLLNVNLLFSTPMVVCYLDKWGLLHCLMILHLFLYLLRNIVYIKLELIPNTLLQCNDFPFLFHFYSFRLIIYRRILFFVHWPITGHVRF